MIRRDLARLADSVGPRVMALTVVVVAVTGAVVGAALEVVRQYGRPYAPKGTPPS